MEGVVASVPNLDLATGFAVRSSRGLAILGTFVLAIGIGLIATMAGRAPDGWALTVAYPILAVLSLEGVSLWVAAFVTRRREQREVALKALHPNAPWMWSESWATGLIRSGRRRGLWADGILHLSVVPPACAFALRTDLQTSDWQGWGMVVAAGAISVIALGWVVQESIRYWRFGFSTFELETLPAVIGEQLRGYLTVPFALPAAAEFHVNLTCYSLGSREGGALWNAEQKVAASAAQARSRGVAIPVAFQIPASCEATNDGAMRVVWRLHATSGRRLFGYLEFFEVPVFRTAASAMRRSVSVAEKPRAAAAESARASCVSSRRTDQGGLDISIVAQRNALARSAGGKIAGGATIAVFTGVFLDTLLRMIWSDKVGWIWGALLGIVGLGIYLAVHRVRARARTTVTIDGESLRIAYRRLGRMVQQQVPRSAITGARVRTAKLDGKKQCYDVELVGEEAPLQDIGVMLDEEDANRVVAEMRGALGLQG